ncbi:MAG: hypothetical protein PHG25_04335 [Candidatus Pacebacteria bacterium]|nr:hypothetical protein [Candidatus Paceibacterota bacterium]
MITRPFPPAHEVRKLVVHETRKFGFAHWAMIAVIFAPILILAYIIVTCPFK